MNIRIREQSCGARGLYPRVAIEVIISMSNIFLFLPTGNFNIIILDRVKLNIALVRNKRSF